MRSRMTRARAIAGPCGNSLRRGLSIAPFLQGCLRNLLPTGGSDAAFYRFVCSCLGTAACRRLAAFLSSWRASHRGKAFRFGERSTRAEKLPFDHAELSSLLEELAGEAGPAFLKALHAFLDGVLEAEKVRQPAVRSFAPLELLCRDFGLDTPARDLLVFLYCRRQNPLLDDYCDRAGSATELVTLMARAIGVRATHLQRCLAARHPLVRTGLIEVGHGDVELSERIAGILGGIQDAGASCIRRDAATVYPPDTFPVSERDRLLAGALLAAARPCRILLYGRPGTGKSEFARTLARASGRPVYHAVCDEGAWGGGETDRRLALHLAAASAARKKAVLVVDRADELLVCQEAPRVPAARRATIRDNGWLEELLDRSPVHMIWITGAHEGIADPLLRRFSYSLEFQLLPLPARARLWLEQVRCHPLRRLLPEAAIRQLAVTHPAAAGGIVAALDSLAAIHQPGEGTALALSRLSNLLEKHERLAGQGRSGPPAVPDPHFDPALLNTDHPPDTLLEALCRYRLREAGLPEGQGRGVNLLFFGPPGTGKSEYAKYLAHVLGLEVHACSAAELLSPYIGVTEKRIRAAFRHGPGADTLLLLDDVEGLLGGREHARRPWEIRFVDEMLARLEQRRGITVCTTNLPQLLDRAAARRFHWKVCFSPLAPAAGACLLERFFTLPAGSLPPDRIGNISAGDCRVLAERLALLEPDGITPARLLAELDRERERGVGGWDVNGNAVDTGRVHPFISRPRPVGTGGSLTHPVAEAADR